jgi:glycosyltransferase involved in cell wall biosynthesis
MKPVPRVAFFTDSFHEVNGVAHTSRHFDAYTRQRGLPFLNIHAGQKTQLKQDGPVWTLELKRSPVGFSLEQDMSFDLLFMRYRQTVTDHLRQFGAELVHITGPSDVGMLGALIAHRLKLPLVASWHTNIHEFGARRLVKLLSFLPSGMRRTIATFTEQEIILALSIQYYRLARVLLAPNLELVEQLQQRTGRPTFLMQRGVDTALFSPEKRDRCDQDLVIGYVGRLSPEKSVRALREVEQALSAAGVQSFRFVIVGDGHERTWLQENLQRVEFTGILTGEDLSRAYANMDIFAFPSHTDTFGNVVLEALASGVPVVITSSGGPKYLVTPGVTGLVSADAQAFSQNIVALARDPDMRHRMRIRARDFALCRYWHRIFEQVYDSYEYCLRVTRPVRRRGTAPAIGRTPA